MSSYVGYRNDKHIISSVLVYLDSNEKEDREVPDNNMMNVSMPALHITIRVMPILEVERWSTR